MRISILLLTGISAIQANIFRWSLDKWKFSTFNCRVVSGVFTTLASFNPFISINDKLDERKSRTNGSRLKQSGGQKRKIGRWMKKKPHRETTFPYHTEPSKVRKIQKERSRKGTLIWNLLSDVTPVSCMSCFQLHWYCSFDPEWLLWYSESSRNWNCKCWCWTDSDAPYLKELLS